MEKACRNSSKLEFLFLNHWPQVTSQVRYQWRAWLKSKWLEKNHSSQGVLIPASRALWKVLPLHQHTLKPCPLTSLQSLLPTIHPQLSLSTAKTASVAYLWNTVAHCLLGFSGGGQLQGSSERLPWQRTMYPSAYHADRIGLCGDREAFIDLFCYVNRFVNYALLKSI